MRKSMRRAKTIAAARKAGKSGLPMVVQRAGRRAIRKGRKFARDPELRRKALRAGLVTASALGGPAALALTVAATSPEVQAKAQRLAKRAKARLRR